MCIDDIVVKFAQNVKGIMPKILERLWKERKAIRKQMKTLSPDDPLMLFLMEYSLLLKFL